LLSAIFLVGLATAVPVVALSTQYDRERFISITMKLENAPLDPKLEADRRWAMNWLIKAPDVSVNVCLAPLGGVSQESYSHGLEVIAQYTFAMGQVVIQHPDVANRPEDQQLAGVEGALNAYQSILRSEPAARSPILDKLVQLRARGELREFVRRALPECSGEAEAISTP